MPPIGVFLLATGLATVHVFAGKLQSLHIVPRSRWLSIAGGISVAYVFIHIFPEIADRQARLADTVVPMNTVVPTTGKQALFMVTLVGFAGFYGLEQLAHRSRLETGSQKVAREAETQTSARVFWVHIGSFAAYNALIGYLLLHREDAGAWNLFLYFTAMAVHIAVNDHGLREFHQDAYEHVARWVLAGAVIVGFTVGFFIDVPHSVISFLFALLAGGIVLNVIKEELPKDRESRFWAFGIGLVVYTFVLLLI